MVELLFLGLFDRPKPFGCTCYNKVLIYILIFLIDNNQAYYSYSLSVALSDIKLNPFSLSILRVVL